MSGVFGYDDAESNASAVAENLETVKSGVMTLWGIVENDGNASAEEVELFRSVCLALYRASQSTRIVDDYLQGQGKPQNVPEAPTSETRVKASTSVGKQKAAR